MGRVREWRRGEGWGVLDSDETPGGCWVHFSVIRIRWFRELRTDQEIEFEWELAHQDGYSCRAISVWPRGQVPYCPEGPGVAGTPAFWSYVVIGGVIRGGGDA